MVVVVVVVVCLLAFFFVGYCMLTNRKHVHIHTPTKAATDDSLHEVVTETCSQ